MTKWLDDVAASMDEAAATRAKREEEDRIKKSTEKAKEQEAREHNDKIARQIIQETAEFLGGRSQIRYRSKNRGSVAWWIESTRYSNATEEDWTEVLCVTRERGYWELRTPRIDNGYAHGDADALRGLVSRALKSSWPGPEARLELRPGTIEDRNRALRDLVGIIAYLGFWPAVIAILWLAFRSC